MADILECIAFQEAGKIKTKPIAKEAHVTQIANHQAVDGWPVRIRRTVEGDVKKSFGQPMVFLAHTQHDHQFLIDDNRMGSSLAIDLGELTPLIKTIGQTLDIVKGLANITDDSHESLLVELRHKHQVDTRV